MDPATLTMVIEHRYMHAETFDYMMHNLPYADKTAGPVPQSSERPAPANPMLRIPGGRATLGRTREGFGWDNEYRAHEIEVPEFGMSKYKISNGEYLGFVREGGVAPNFWSLEGGRWFYRGMFARIPLPLDSPVCLTWQQAEAYANWRGASLPSEAQFHPA